MVSGTSSPRQGDATLFRVIDVLDHPHGGLILRLRLQEGGAPSVKALKGATLEVASPDGGTKRSVKVDGFAVFGGRPSDERIRRTGRVDVHVFELEEDEAGEPINLQWTASLLK